MNDFHLTKMRECGQISFKTGFQFNANNQFRMEKKYWEHQYAQYAPKNQYTQF